MKAVVVGTAGHIDHGKSALVRALTGTDPDRLEEEKRRGITIDLGFANMNLVGSSGEEIRVAFVDVPGHERFVRNMLAGIGGIDLVLLVIAADEGIKPQTREHFDITRLLGVQRGLTVLTKSDLVDPESLAVVRMEVTEYLKGSFLDPEYSPLLVVSSKTGEGLDDLKHELARIASALSARDANAAFRLPIDRVFTMKGFGTVITGTLISGTVHREEELELYPSGKRVRVRGIQVHSQPAERASAGQRTALNLAGIEAAEIQRGMVLCHPGLFMATTRSAVRLRLLPSAKPLRDGARVHLHAFTGEAIAEVQLLEGSKQLTPGTSGLARVKADKQQLLLPGDRFIIRRLSPVTTIGGGEVLDAVEPARRSRADDRLAFLRQLSQVSAGDGSERETLLARIQRRGSAGLSIADAVVETGWLPGRARQIANALQQDGKVVLAATFLVGHEEFAVARRQAIDTVDRFHRSNPLVGGINKEQLRESLGLSPEVFQTVLAAAVEDKKLELGGELVRVAGRTVVLRDDEADSKVKIEAAFADSGLQVPALKEVLAGLHIDQTRAHKIVTLLLRDRILVKVSDDLVFHRDALARLRRQVVAEKARTPKLNIASFKELFGITRKYAIPLLEYLDRERVTKRVGDERIIL